MSAVIFSNESSAGTNHYHLNYAILTRMGEQNGTLTYKGYPILTEGVIDDGKIELGTTWSSLKLSKEFANVLSKELLNKPNGVASLDSNGKIPLLMLPETLKEIRVVENITKRNELTVFEGMKVLVLDAFDDIKEHKPREYTWTGSKWFGNTIDTNLILDWSNIKGKPNSTPLDIDKSVKNMHEHLNLSVLQDLGNDNGNLTFKDKPVSLSQGNVLMFVEKIDQLPTAGSEGILYLVKSDKSNYDKPSLYSYNIDTNSYEKLGGSTGSSGGSSNLQQITKLGVVAPKTFELKIPYSDTFNFNEIVVLKFKPGLQNRIISYCDFDNSNRDDFEENKYLEFDGVMKLQTDYRYPMNLEGEYDEGHLFKVDVNMSELETIDSVKNDFGKFIVKDGDIYKYFDFNTLEWINLGSSLSDFEKSNTDLEFLTLSLDSVNREFIKDGNLDEYSTYSFNLDKSKYHEIVGMEVY